MSIENTNKASQGNLFLSINREEIIGSVTNFIKNREGIFVLTGEKGCGKSLFAHNISSYLEQTKSILVDEIYTTEDGLLRFICKELNVEMADSHIFELLLDRLSVKLLECYKEGTGVLLVVDHFDELNDDVVDAILKIGNLKYSGDSLIQIMLVSDYAGIKWIREKELEYVDRLFNLVLDMKSLNLQECKPFTVNVLKSNGVLTDAISDSEVELIFNYTEGNQGKINSLIEHILLASHSKGMPDKVRIAEAAEALGYIKNDTVESIDNFSKKGIIATVTVSLLVLILIVFKLFFMEKETIVIVDNTTDVVIVEEKPNNNEVTAMVDNVTNIVLDNASENFDDNLTDEIVKEKDNKSIDNKKVDEIELSDTDDKLVLGKDNVSNSKADNVTELPKDENVITNKCVKLKKNLNFRVSPSLDAERINVLAADTTHKIIIETDFWVKIRVSDREGWIYKSMNFLEIYDCE